MMETKGNGGVGDIDAQPSTLESLEDSSLEMLENSPLRVLGYFGRVGRLAGQALSKGSRYIAYSSDVAESFRPVIDPKYIQLGYGVAIAYVVADVGLTAHAAKKANEDVTRATAQQATFQVLGSLILPSVVIHQTVHASQKAFAKIGRYQKWGPVIAGLALIPLMPVLIDEPTEHVVHAGFAKFWPKDTPSASSHS